MSLIKYMILALSVVLVNAEEICPSEISVEAFKKILPSLERTNEEGGNGRLLVLEGASEIATRAYFIAMSALKSGSDHVHVFSPEYVAGTVQSYSPDFAVFPYYSSNEMPMIEYAVSRVDVVVLGPGPGEDLFLVPDIVQLCKDKKKALIVKTGAVYEVAMNISILDDYPAPGVILVPDPVELEVLTGAISGKNASGEDSKLENVSVFVMGKKDQFYSKNGLEWQIDEESVSKHTEEQADMLAGFLGTFYNWAIKSKACANDPHYTRSIASYAAAKLSRASDQEAYDTFGRSMTSTDILNVVHRAFRGVFESKSVPKPIKPDSAISVHSDSIDSEHKISEPVNTGSPVTEPVISNNDESEPIITEPVVSKPVNSESVVSQPTDSEGGSEPADSAQDVSEFAFTL